MLGATLALLAASQILVPGACMHLLVFLACVDGSETDPEGEAARPPAGLIGQAQAAGPMGPSLEVEEEPATDPKCAWLPYQTPKGDDYFVLSVDPQTSGTFAVLPANCVDSLMVQRSPSTEPVGFDPSSVPVLPGQVARVYACSGNSWHFLGEADLSWADSADVQEVLTIKEHGSSYDCAKRGHNVPFPARLTVHRPR